MLRLFRSPAHRLRHGCFILITLFLFLPSGTVLTANPFLGAGDHSSPAPVRAVVGGNTGPFTELQLAFREKTGTLLSRLGEKPGPVPVITFLLAAFAYGLFHSAGPGHRKTVIFSLFLSRTGTRWYEPLTAGFLSAGIHAFTALGLIGIYTAAGRGLADLTGTSDAGIFLEGFTFLFLILLSLVLILLKLRELIRRKPQHHGPAGGRNLYLILLVSSLVPCPGATMLMLMAVFLHLPWAGILGVVAMSMGMGVVISSVGFLAAGGRAGLFLRLKDRESLIRLIAGIMETASYLFIGLFSLFMAWPFLLSLISRF